MVIRRNLFNDLIVSLSINLLWSIKMKNLFLLILFAFFLFRFWIWMKWVFLWNFKAWFWTVMLSFRTLMMLLLVNFSFVQHHFHLRMGIHFFVSIVHDSSHNKLAHFFHHDFSWFTHSCFILLYSFWSESLLGGVSCITCKGNLFIRFNRVSRVFGNSSVEDILFKIWDILTMLHCCLVYLISPSWFVVTCSWQSCECDVSLLH